MNVLVSVGLTLMPGAIVGGQRQTLDVNTFGACWRAFSTISFIALKFQATCHIEALLTGIGAWIDTSLVNTISNLTNLDAINSLGRVHRWL